jgi:alkylhydroperoxidase/carboxymuconolactone decarboxylase family protein
MIDPRTTAEILRTVQDLCLVSAAEVDQIRSIFDDRFAFANALREADTIHIHVRVDDVAALLHERIRAAGGTVDHQRDGYIKYAFAGGTNLIFSSIPVAQDDLLPGAPAPRPFLDHVGIDLRRETASVRNLFDQAPERARALGWRHVAQGDERQPVYCCHTSVASKHWVYPPAGDALARPLELAFGALTIHAGKMGCDLRPLDPAHLQAGQALCGNSGEHPRNSGSAAYYDTSDLARFGEVGRFAAATFQKFIAYYEVATEGDSALSRREKALIALAVAHAKQCPYCIDAYTARSLESGASIEQMHEAVHVAAALAAGIDLVHATQMHNKLRHLGALGSATDGRR